MLTFLFSRFYQYLCHLVANPGGSLLSLPWTLRSDGKGKEGMWLELDQLNSTKPYYLFMPLYASICLFFMFERIKQVVVSQEIGYGI